jgi:hypothetical protein
MSTVGLIALLLAATPVRESNEIIGFSKNEKLAAWRIDVAQPQPDGLIDFYSLVRVVDAHNGATVATFRASRVRRTSIAGLHSGSTQRQLVAANPRFAAAQPQSALTRFKRRARFVARNVRMDHPSVRLIPDRDHDLRGSATRERLQIQGPVRGPVGFTAVAHLESGRNVEIDHFSHDAPDSGRMVAFVRAQMSASGRGLLVHTTFAVDDGGLILSASHVAILRLDSPLDIHPSARHAAARRQRAPRKKWEAFMDPTATAEQVYDKYVGGFGRANNRHDYGRNGIEPAYEVDLTAVVTSTDFPW